MSDCIMWLPSTTILEAMALIAVIFMIYLDKIRATILTPILIGLSFGISELVYKANIIADCAVYQVASTTFCLIAAFIVRQWAGRTWQDTWEDEEWLKFGKLGKSWDRLRIAWMINALSNKRALVRQQAANYFLIRARRGIPVLEAVRPLFNALIKEKEMQKLKAAGDPRDEEKIARFAAGPVMANAIAATIGAEESVIRWDREIDPKGMREEFLKMQSSDDPVEREDATKYLKHLFEA
jgi:hypothetical protein